MKILVVSNNYPSNQKPSNGIFLYRLVQKFVELGHEVTVVSNKKIWDVFNRNYNDYGQEKARIIRPLTLSVSAKQIDRFNTYRLSHYFNVKAAQSVIKNHNAGFDIIYAHFLRNAFVAVDAISPQINAPIVAAVGENKGFDNTIAWFGKTAFLNKLSKIDGFVAVSEQVKSKLINNGVDKQFILTEPNATDLSVFKQLSKEVVRKKHNIPNDRIIIAFAGNLIESKGPQRLLNAVDRLNNIGVIILGDGPVVLRSDKIVFQKRVSGNLMPELLNCADLFVLPTLHEGSNNSIVEAMACGLPIISSDIPEIRSQCDPSFSILVNPVDENALTGAIDKLMVQPLLREQMSQNALNWSKKFDLTKRAERILTFLNRFVDK